MKVFLKFNKDTQSAKMCLEQWIDIFEGYEIQIICDLEDPYEIIGDIMAQYPVVNTNYKLGFKYSQCFGGKKANHWQRAGSANLTAYKLAKDDEYFWLIDADDTMFITEDISPIKEKIKQAEQYCKEKSLDGFSLDFYREIVNNHWSFGVAILKTDVDLSLLRLVDPIRAIDITKVANMDSAFDLLKRDGHFTLESFVFNGTFFQHHVDRKDWLPYGVYYWKDGKLWNKTELAKGVISF